MDILKAIEDWAAGFFGIGQFMKILNSSDYKSFLTYE